MAAKPKANYGKMVEVQDGETHKYHLRKDGTSVVYTVCCDCNLTHLEEFTPKKDHIRVRVWRDDEKTSDLRRQTKKRKRRK